MLPTAENIVSGLFGTLDFAKGIALSPDYSRILNSKKVSDHHAIIPTAEAVKTDKGSLPESERNILLLLSMKLLSATAQPYRYEAVTASFDYGGITFTAKGKTVKCEGFKELERRFRAALKTKPEDRKATKENPLPELTEGQEITAKAVMTEHDTTPPTAYIEDTLLSAIERDGNGDITKGAEQKGLGTPATRAAVLEKLVQAGFVERKKKQLIPTKDGKNLVAVLPDTLTSPKPTAEWENALTAIAKGEADPDSFTRGIEAMAAGLVKEYAAVPEEKKKLFAPERKEIGKCPRCGSPVYAYCQELKREQLFQTAGKDFMTKSSYVKMWDSIRQKMNAPSLTAYIFRHNYCTNQCYQIPVISIKKIAELLGDHEKMVIEVYNHILLEKEDAEKAVKQAFDF